MASREDGSADMLCAVCTREIKLPSPKGSTPLHEMLQQPEGSQLDMICSACKKFYWRSRQRGKRPIGKCVCPIWSQGCTQGMTGTFCRACRLSRYEQAVQRQQNDLSLMYSEGQMDQPGSSTAVKPTPNNNRRPSLQLVPCQVCGASSSGYHFGVISCEGCKGFFRRSLEKHKEYKCTLQGNASSPHDINRCKHCRYQACVAAGMSNTTLRVGRHSMQQRMQTTMFVKRLAAENRLLANRTLRRGSRRRSIDTHVDIPPSNDTSTISVGSSPNPQVYTETASDEPWSTPLFQCSTMRPRNNYKMFHLDHPTSISPRATTFPGVIQMSDYMASLPATIQSQTAFRLQVNELEIHSIVQTAVDALSHLKPLVDSQGRAQANHLPIGSVWSTYMTENFELHVRCVLNFIRSLRGFTDILVPDRIKLFSHAYFPILMAQLSLFYDDSNRLFSLPEQSPFNQVTDFCQQEAEICFDQLVDASKGVRLWKPSQAEFAILCALLFFNPSVPDLEEVDKVRSLKATYELVDESVNMRGLQTVFSVANHASSNSSGSSYIPANQRFSCLIGYFQPLAKLYAQVLDTVKSKSPALFENNSLLADMHARLMPLMSS